MFADNTFAATLNAIDKQNVFAFVAMVGLVINVGVNLDRDSALWIPRRQLGGRRDRGRARGGGMVRAARAARDDPGCEHLMEGDRRRTGHGRASSTSPTRTRAACCSSSWSSPRR